MSEIKIFKINKPIFTRELLEEEIYNMTATETQNVETVIIIHGDKRYFSDVNQIIKEAKLLQRKTSVNTENLETVAYKYRNSPFSSFHNLVRVVFASISDSAKNEVETIDEFAFYNCSNLKTIIIPDSVTAIGNHAFDGCTSLENIAIPDSVTAIGDRAFCRCTSLASITIPDSVTTIGDDAFSRCESIETIFIGKNVSEIKIGVFAFGECSALENLYIPLQLLGEGSTETAPNMGFCSDGTSLRKIFVCKGDTPEKKVNDIYSKFKTHLDKSFLQSPTLSTDYQYNEAIEEEGNRLKGEIKKEGTILKQAIEKGDNTLEYTLKGEIKTLDEDLKQRILNMSIMEGGQRITFPKKKTKIKTKKSRKSKSSRRKRRLKHKKSTHKRKTKSKTRKTKKKLFDEH